jgi:hypothetical protein
VPDYRASSRSSMSRTARDATRFAVVFNRDVEHHSS